jgi:hypothetical protein
MAVQPLRAVSRNGPHRFAFIRSEFQLIIKKHSLLVLTAEVNTH